MLTKFKALLEKLRPYGFAMFIGYCILLFLTDHFWPEAYAVLSYLNGVFGFLFILLILYSIIRYSYAYIQFQYKQRHK